jgi:hypothetical protein
MKLRGRIVLTMLTLSIVIVVVVGLTGWWCVARQDKWSHPAPTTAEHMREGVLYRVVSVDTALVYNGDALYLFKNAKLDPYVMGKTQSNEPLVARIGMGTPRETVIVDCPSEAFPVHATPTLLDTSRYDSVAYGHLCVSAP